MCRPFLLFCFSLLCCLPLQTQVVLAKTNFSQEVAKQAEAFEKEKEYGKADKLWADLVQKEPENPYYLYRLGRVYAWQGRYPEAEQLLLRSLELNPRDADVKLSLANVYLWTDRRPQAKKLFQEILKDYPDYKDAQKGLLAISKAEKKKMTSFKKEIVESHKQSALVVVENALNQKKKATEEAEEFEKRKEYVQAEKIWQSLLEQEPDSPLYLYKLGRVYAWTGRYNEAEKLLNRSLKINPKDADVQLSLAYLYFWTKREEKAKELFNKILKEHPDYEDARKGLEKIEESIREREKEKKEQGKEKEEKGKKEEEEEKAKVSEFEPWQENWIKVAECLERRKAYTGALNIWRFLFDSSREWPTIEAPHSLGDSWLNETIIRMGLNCYQRLQFEKQSEKYLYLQKYFAFHIGQVLSWMGEWEQSAAYLNYALSLDLNYSEAWLRLGYVALFTGQLEWSRQIFWELLSKDQKKPDPDVVEGFARASQALLDNCVARKAYCLRMHQPEPNYFIVKNFSQVLHWTDPWLKGVGFYAQEKETDLITKVLSAQRNTYFASGGYYQPINEVNRFFVGGFAGREREINLIVDQDNFNVFEWKYGCGFDALLNPWLTLKTWFDVKQGRDVGHPIFPFGFHRRYEPGAVLLFTPPYCAASLSYIRDSFIVKRFSKLVSDFLRRDTYLGQIENGYFNNWVYLGILGFYSFYREVPLNRQWEGQTWFTVGYPRYEPCLFVNFRARISGFKFTDTDYYSYKKQWEYFAKVFYLKEPFCKRGALEIGYHRSWQWSRNLNQPINTAIFIQRLFRATNKAYLEYRYLPNPNINLTFRTEYYTDTTEYSAWSFRGELHLIF